MSKAKNVVGGIVAAGCLLAVMVTAGCSSSGGDSKEDSLGAKVLQGLSPLQKTILADKKVTQGEYERAVQDTVGCLRTAGFTVTDPVKSPDGTLKFMSSYSPPKAATNGPVPPSEMNKISGKNAACERRSAAVQAVFILAHAPSEAEGKQAFAMLVTCAETLGVKISVSKDSQDIPTVMKEIDTAKEQRLITVAQANSCKEPFGASTLRPLPGLSEALALYEG